MVPSVAKPLTVSLTVIANGNSGQKIYLTRVTANLSIEDDQGPLDPPRALVDTANISPGFIVTFLYTYGQVFTIPAVDDAAMSVKIDFSYELLLQSEPGSDDYSKQTATDSVVVPLEL